jgi:hypothetical protein
MREDADGDLQRQNPGREAPHDLQLSSTRHRHISDSGVNGNVAVTGAVLASIARASS